ncbi:MAG: hypothetical protein BWK80_07025 [Desulfobacteraceae bacterium IS3]|nr:MAG: hypothetical protein BWK80_07025 [Desulfobacteraceae bacterium IS3]
MLKTHSRITRLISVIIIFLFLFCPPLYADGTHPQGIKLDGTIGTAGKIELPGPNYAIKPEYGKQSGANLFHSFQQFNIHSGESATFSGPASVQNIISRVTGGSASRIDGKLASTISGADLYFLNPAGVMFGSNASLDLSGSFHVSTADYLRMGESERFYSKPIENEVLSVAAPSAFGFLSDTPAKISTDGSFLKVSEGKTLSLAGGNIELHNSILYAQGGQVNLASAASAGEIKLTETGVEADGVKKSGNIDILRTKNNETPTYGDIEVGSMENGYNGGSVFIRGGNVVMEGTVIESFSFKGSSGDIRLNVNTLAMNNNAQIANAILETETIADKAEKNKAGNIDIEAGKVTLTDGAQIGSITRGRGDAGNINIRVADTLSISGANTSGAVNDFITGISADSSGAGNAGRIDIQAGQMQLRDGSQIGSNTLGSGQGGMITIRADEFTASGGAVVVANTEGTGNAGSIEIQTGHIQLRDGSQIGSSTFGSGDGGTIKIITDEFTASGIVNDASSGVFANSAGTEIGAGKAGSIDIKARQIHLTDGGTIRSMTYGAGDGGMIKIIADETLTASGVVRESDPTSGIYANSGGQGKAGSIDIQAGQIQVKDGSQIGSSSFGAGDGGKIKIIADQIRASGTVNDHSSGIFANSTSTESGAGDDGVIDIHAHQIHLADGGTIRSITSGSGDGGTIKIIADETLTASGVVKDGDPPSGIYVNSGGQGNAGNVDIQAHQIQLTGRAVISSSTSGSGDGGKIKIVADELTASGRIGDHPSGIHASSYSTEVGAGNAGNIEIKALQINLTDGAAISSHTKGTGAGGSISIGADESFSTSGDGSGIFASSYSTEAGAGKAGVIDLHARQIHLTDGGGINSHTMGTGEAGTINIRADESFSISGYDSGILASSYSTGAGGGRAGIVDIYARQINLTDGGAIISTTYGTGEGGQITINADEFTASGVINDFSSGIFASSYSTEVGAGNAGVIDIHARQIHLTDGGKIKDETAGPGKGGTIKIVAEEALTASGKAVVAANSGGQGNAGSIDIQAGQIQLKDGSQISSGTWGSGEGGAITIRADDITASGFVNDNPSGIFANSSGTGNEAGNAGVIDIHARQIHLTDAGTIRSLTYGPGDGGTIKIIVDETLTASGIARENEDGSMPSSIIANSEGTGNAGSIDIHARQIHLADGGTIRSLTYGPGDGGTIKIIADETLTASGALKKVNPTGINASSSGTGKAGSIDIQTGQIQLTDGAQIGSSTSGSGQGGKISIRADELTASSALKDLPSGFFAESSGAGNAGSVDIHARQLYLTEGGRIIGETSGSGEGGKINIVADEALTASGESLISATSSGTSKAGSIDIQAGQIQLTEGAQISNGTLGSGEGGTITIRADEVTASGVFNNSASGIYANSSGTGKAGSVDIQAGGQVQLRDGSQISSGAWGSGEGGSIKIIADEVSASGAINDIPSGIFANSSGTGEEAGKAGSIDIHARQIHLTDAGTIRSMTYGPGDGGTIKIIADESLTASGVVRESKEGKEMPSGIVTNAQSTGNAGVIDIHARQIHLTDGGTIRGMTSGPGEGGKIKIIADEALTASGVAKKINPTSINTDSKGQGNAGSIDIQAGQIQLKDGSQIGSSTSGFGQGGKITIRADEITASSIFNDIPSGFFANSEGIEAGSGNAGGIEIHVRQIHLSGEGVIRGETSGPGEGGKIKIVADEALTASGKSIVSASSIGTGNSGSIDIQAGQIKLRDGAQLSTTTGGAGEGGKIIIEADEVVSSGLSKDGHPSGIFARSQGTGNAGEIIINAAGSVRLTDGNYISTEALSAGGGKINVNAGNSIYLCNSQISSTVKQSEGNGGDVTTRSKFVILNHAKITANAQEGDGGAVFIQTDNFLKSADSRVTATSERGNQGTVEIEAPDLNLSGVLMFLPGSILDAAQFAPTPCYARSGRTFSTFVITGPDAVPTPADDLHSAPLSATDTVFTSEDTTSVSEYLNLSDYFGKKKFSPRNEPCETCDKK